MKLAFSLFDYFPFGGLQRDFLNIAAACKKNHAIDVYTMGWSGQKPDDLNIITLPNTGWFNHSKNKQFSGDLLKKLSANSYDLVIGFNKTPGLDVYFAADTCYREICIKKRPFLNKISPRDRTLLALEKAVFSKEQAVKIWMISEKEIEIYQHHYGTPDKRFFLLPPGICRSRTIAQNGNQKFDMRQNLNLPANKKILLFIGSSFKTKGLDRAIRAFAALPDEQKTNSILLVIGNDQPAKFRTLISTFNIEPNIQFLGSKNNIEEYIIAADLLVHPPYVENGGIVILEALVNGLPILTIANCGFSPHVVKANAGIVCQLPFNQIDYNEKLLFMLNSDLHATWSKNGIDYGQHEDLYSLPEQAAKWIDSWGSMR